MSLNSLGSTVVRLPCMSTTYMTMENHHNIVDEDVALTLQATSFKEPHLFWHKHRSWEDLNYYKLCITWSWYPICYNFPFFVLQEGDVTITKFIQRVEGIYNMEAEVGVVFVDFDKCQAVCNFLVEKLDDSVLVSQPNYFHSSHGLEIVRWVEMKWAVGVGDITNHTERLMSFKFIGCSLLNGHASYKFWTTVFLHLWLRLL